jgi:hypothetical protein
MVGGGGGVSCVNIGAVGPLALAGWAKVFVVGRLHGQVVEVTMGLELYRRIFFLRGHSSLKA